MRTRTTLLCAAALAAGVASSWAQSNVYSLNIVGYANVPTPNGVSFQSNPFEVTPSDYATNVIPNPNTAQGGSYSGPWDASSLQIWNGAGFNIVYFDSETSDTTTGFADINNNPLPCPNLTSGLGYVFNNQSGASNNVTYVGTVRTGTNAITYPLSPRAYAIGSPLPLAGGIISALGMSNPNTAQGGSYSGPLDGASVEIVKTTPGGLYAGFKVFYFDSETSDSTTGFSDVNNNQLPEPQVGIGGAYFFLSEGPAAYTWTQVLNP
jgi:hypothetical protein